MIGCEVELHHRLRPLEHPVLNLRDLVVAQVSKILHFDTVHILVWHDFIVIPLNINSELSPGLSINLSTSISLALLTSL